MLPYPQKEFYPVANVKEKAWPFKIKAKENNDTLVILAHGFTSSPGAMVDLADFWRKTLLMWKQFFWLVMAVI